MVNNIRFNERSVSSGSNESGSTPPESPEFERLQQLMQKISLLNDRINKFDAPRTNFSVLLENEDMLAVYHKEFSNVAKQLRFVKMFRQYFMKDLENNPESANGKINTHLKSLQGLMQLFDPKDIAKLNNVILMLSKQEISELMKCIEDIKSWGRYRLTNRIEFFTKRLIMYVKGGKDELSGVNYLGLAASYKDAVLVKEMFSIPQIKKLWVYTQEIDFFSRARYIVQQALKPKGEGNWNLFLGTAQHNYKDGFYYNLKDGKKYIGMVRNIFGNPEFADLLERTEKIIHQSPVDWDLELGELQHRLHNFTYQNQNVIQPAANALIELFQKAIDRISASRVEFKELDLILKTLKKNIEARMQKLRQGIKRLQNEYDPIDDKIDAEMDIVMPALFNHTVTIGEAPKNRLSQLSRVVNVSGAWLGKYKTDYSRQAGRAFFEASQVDKLAVTRHQLINSQFIDNTFDFGIRALENRINRRLIPLLQGAINFILAHDQEFTTPISTTEDLLPEVKIFMMQIQAKLDAELKKEGIDLGNPLYG